MNANPDLLQALMNELQSGYDLKLCGIHSSEFRSRKMIRLWGESIPKFDERYWKKLDARSSVYVNENRTYLKTNLKNVLPRLSEEDVIDPMTIFVIEGVKDDIDSDQAWSISRLYFKNVMSRVDSLPHVINRSYLNSSSSTLGLGAILRETLNRHSIDHISILRIPEIGQVEALAQAGQEPWLDEHEIASWRPKSSRRRRAIALRSHSFTYLPDPSYDPLSGFNSGKGRVVSGGSMYLSLKMFSADLAKSVALSDLWLRGVTVGRQSTWEDVVLLFSLGEGAAVIASVGSLLTARLAQIQRMSHSNEQTLSGMASNLSQAFSDLDSLNLLSKGKERYIGANELQTHVLSVKNWLDYVRLNVHQMQAKITLLRWLENYAGGARAPKLEYFNPVLSIRSIMDHAPAVMKPFNRNRGKPAGLFINFPNRPDLIGLEAFARRDIFEFALFNVMENAIKYRVDDVSIECKITTGRRKADEDSFLKVSVSDWGFGIDEEDTKLIFEDGWRSSRHSRLDIPGYGLGLFQTKALLNLIGCDIVLESRRNPTTFTIVISQFKGGWS